MHCTHAPPARVEPGSPSFEQDAEFPCSELHVPHPSPQYDHDDIESKRVVTLEEVGSAVEAAGSADAQSAPPPQLLIPGPEVLGSQAPGSQVVLSGSFIKRGQRFPWSWRTRTFVVTVSEGTKYVCDARPSSPR